MPPAERRAFLLLLLLAILGQGVRHLLTRPGEAPGQVQLLSTISPGSPLAQKDSAIRLARPLRPGERVDVDAAPVSELARLPRVGPRLAKIILADRIANGPFGGLEGLDRVAGIGPGLLKLLKPHVVFSGAGARWAAGQRGSGALRSTQAVPACDEAAVQPTHCPSGQQAPAPLNLNSATLTELDALPGVGPAKAAAILQYREEKGPFTAVEQLAQVPGFGPAALSRLRERLVIR
jgi:competence ComEA-like helix-hairpin-helix protein